MRSSDEFKREFWRRYRDFEQRRKEKRKRMLAVAAPTAACILLICAALPFLHHYFPDYAASNEGSVRPENAVSYTAGESISNALSGFQPYLEIVLDYTGYTVVNPEAVRRLGERLEELTQAVDGPTDDEENPPDWDAPRYEIRIVIQDGEEDLYLYAQGQLRGPDGVWVSLDGETAAELEEWLDELIQESKGG